MHDMRDCYDRLLSASAATVNSIYEFSESLEEMGDCLLEKTALSDDEESGKVLLMLGKVQFELQKLVDGYRSHVLQTITIPSESLLNELQIVEEMKRRCDGKRDMYEEMMKKYKVKGRSRNSEGECFSSRELRVARDDYDEEANIFVFRMKSLKQGQSHSLLTQAARHHAAQLSFFKKALSSLEAIEPHVKLVSERHHIEYQFSGLEDENGSNIDYDHDESNDDDNDTDDGTATTDDGELSFDYGQNDPVVEVSTLACSMEENLERNPGQNSFSFRREFKTISKSAPLLPEKKFDPAGRLSQLRPSPSHKFASYVLPTPVEIKDPGTRKSDAEAPQPRQARVNLWHSSPLVHNKYEKLVANEKLSGPMILDSESVLKESNINSRGSQLPPSFSDGRSSKQFDPSVASNTKKVKRQAFSGPLTGQPWPNYPNFWSSGPIMSSGYPPFSGSLLRTPLPRPTSTPKLSSCVSPSFVSSPKISELHELPLPPAHLTSKRPSNLVAHSGPLVSKGNELSVSNISMMSTAKSTPPMPETISRSYSIPSEGQMEVALRVPSEASQTLEMADEISTPPLTPTSLPNNRSPSPTSG
ncbi:uncharacterized protein At2g33490-like [Olea europaea var. sylvestris]|uniref:uncharacterized protein At2g33490-like n=1 Tax=Olea europaea var. sylvestris TaxID=158386 RepID=UPI000C1D471A|nr:uncharacterized protein At2g33490-like [Olea europaea var. sylvestris]XP_022887678.1 uncharacterized protein At2g33490-like [Olea europaea var. sylvestris]